MKMLRIKSGKKLRSQLGETIGETLVSLLIGALALTMLAGAVTTAGRLVKDSRNNLDSYYSQRDVLTEMSSSGTVGDMILSDSSAGTSVSQSQKVELYYNSEQFGHSTVAAYKISLSNS